MKQVDDEWIRELARDDERRLTEHPSPETLLAYHERQLGEADREALQEHLVLCRECSSLLLGLQDMMAGSASATGDADWQEAWPEAKRRWQDSTRESTAEASPSTTFGPRSIRELPLAAILALAVVGLLLWNLRLHNEVRQLSAPRLNVAVHDLGTDSLLRAEDDDAVDVVEWGDSGDVLLILTPADEPDRLRYRVRIVDADGRQLWSQSSLRPSMFGNFTLLLPRSAFPDERYSIEVRDDESGSQSAPPRYRFEVRFSDPRS